MEFTFIYSFFTLHKSKSVVRSDHELKDGLLSRARCSWGERLSERQQSHFSSPKYTTQNIIHYEQYKTINSCRRG